jgi:hypothetical protein
MRSLLIRVLRLIGIRRALTHEEEVRLDEYLDRREHEAAQWETECDNAFAEYRAAYRREDWAEADCHFDRLLVLIEQGRR